MSVAHTCGNSKHISRGASNLLLLLSIFDIYYNKRSLNIPITLKFWTRFYAPKHAFHTFCHTVVKLFLTVTIT